MFENLKADLRRLGPAGKASYRTLFAGLLSQGFQAIVVYRFFNWLYRHGWPGQPLRFFCERFIEITTGISIPAACRIGKGLRIHHFGGIILHPTAVLGENCTLYHGVTIGDRGGYGDAAKIGNNVLIGAGAKIIGEVNIDDNVIVGANSVVIRDVPEDMVVVGSPARFIVRKDFSKESVKPNPLRVMDFRGTYKGGGGPDKTVLNSAAMHDPKRVDIRVVYIRDPRDKEFQIGDRAMAMGLNYTEFFDKKLLDFACIRQLAAFVRREHIQLLHCHDDKTALYGFFLKILCPSLKLVFTVHLHTLIDRRDFGSPLGYLKAWLRRRMIIWLIKRYQRPIMAVSEHTRHALAVDGIPLQDTVTLRNCIDINAWKKSAGKPILREELGLDNNVLLVGTVARIAQKHKDLPTFYRLAEILSEKFENVRFVIVGDGHGDLLDKARQDVREMGLEHKLFFTGHRNDLLDIYRSFDIFLMTSFTEGLPNTVLEAMAMEVPVVSTAVAGVPEMIEDGRTGLLCPIRDIDALSSAVLELLEKSEMRRQFGVNGRRRIEGIFDFSWRVNTIEKFYLAYAQNRPINIFANYVCYQKKLKERLSAWA